LVDLDLGHESGVELARSLRREHPTLSLVLIADGQVTPRLLRSAGARSFISKEWCAARIVDVIRIASPESRPKSDSWSARAKPLSARENDVLQHLVRGLSNAEVALELHLSPHTVKQHTSTVYRKLSARNRAEAASRAYQLGLVAAA
jgi:two-component system response regulator DesR